MASVFDFGRYNNFKFKVSLGDDFGHLRDTVFETVDIPGEVTFYAERTIRNWTCPECGHIAPDFGDRMLTCVACDYEVINVEAEATGPLALEAP